MHEIHTKALLLLTVLFSSSAHSHALAQETDEPDPIQVHAEELVAVIRSQDRQRIHEFLNRNCSDAFLSQVPIEMQVKALLRMSRAAPELRIHERIDEHHFLLHNPLEDSWDLINIDALSEPPHLITSLRFKRGEAPADMRPPGNLSDAAITVQAKGYLDRMAAADVFSGTVLIAHGDKVLLREAYGQASKRYAVDNNIDTRFYIASITKSLTATAVLQLVQEGALDLEDSVSDYLGADWIDPQFAAGIQIEHLLSHSSGLGDWDWDAWRQTPSAKFDSVSAYQVIVPRDAPRSEPGKRFGYSNSGFIMLGAIIEQVTGMDYAEYLQEKVFEPAKMSQSGCYLFSRPVPNIATGYVWDEQGDGYGYSNNTMNVPAHPHPAGGVYSNVDDLLGFIRALRRGVLLDDDFRDLAWSSKPELGSPRYGFGFMIDEVDGENLIGHSGGFSGVSTNLDHFVDADYTIVVLSNYENSKWPIVFKLRELIGRRQR